MNFNKIIMLINLILMIYSCNAVIVNNYDQSNYTSKYYSDLEQIEKLITKITITDGNDNTIYVNAFVNEFTVYFIKNLIKEGLNIKRITYSYDNYLITMSNFETQISAPKNSSIIYSIFNKHRPQNEIENFSTLFLNPSFFSFNRKNKIRLDQRTLSLYLNQKRLGSIDLYYSGLNFKGDTNIFDLQSKLISDSHWYIIGKIEGAIDNKFKLIPVMHIDRDIYLYKLETPYMAIKSKFFISLNNVKFGNDDVGAYLIYGTKYNNLRIFAQITAVHTTKDNTQILLLQVLNNRIIPYNKYTYTQYSSSPIEEKDSFKKLVTYENSTHEEFSPGQDHSNSEQSRKRQNTVDVYPENSKRPKVGVNLKFTCDSINELGDYKFNDIIIHVTHADKDGYASSLLLIYDIKGYYEYGTIKQNFYGCHIGNDSSNNKPFLIINSKTGDGFYPNDVLR